MRDKTSAGEWTAGDDKPLLTNKRTTSRKTVRASIIYDLQGNLTSKVTRLIQIMTTEVLGSAYLSVRIRPLVHR